jgi:putative DNA primase/helicase
LPYAWARDILSVVEDRAYLEVSISGKGVHIVFRGTLPRGRRQCDEPSENHVGFALYDGSRFFTFSGHVFPGSGPIQDLTAAMEKLHARLFPARPSVGNGHQLSSPPDVSDAELIGKAHSAANGPDFTRLWQGDWKGRYPSQSEADLALCRHLAFWTGRDAARMDSLFRQSGLYRPEKWQERADYRERTIERAIEQTHEVYDPRRRSDGLSTDGHSPGGAKDEWPTPQPIPGGLSPVEPFCEDLLPEVLRSLVVDIAERMQVPMDYPAVAIVLSLAGVVSRRASIQPKENDTGWVVVPNLWGGIVGPPGYLKSPVIQAATRPLNQIQAEWRREHDEALEDYGRGKEEHELRRAAWKEQFKAASKNGNAAPDRPTGEPNMPTLRRLVVNDATFEALHQTMSDNPAGILVVRDELTGWLAQLDRPGREGERAFYLQAWNGDTGHTIDRIQRGTIHVPACCVSMLGGIQPGRLRSYLADAVKDGPSNDGLAQRFQLLVWPDTAPDWEYKDRPPDADAEQKAAIIFRRLLDLNPENPARFRFAPDAQALFIEWLAELEAKVRGDGLHPALIAHLSKYRSLMPSLALLFELAGQAGASLAVSQNFVGLESARRSAAWCSYLESHARRVYSCIVAPQLQSGRALAERIRHRDVGNGGHFTCREVYVRGWSGLDTPEAAKMAAEVLKDLGWLRSLPGESGPLGGRPPDRYEVNPEVWK